MRYHPPTEHHGHWSITDAEGVEVLCPHTPPPPELIDLLNLAQQLVHQVAPGNHPTPAATAQAARPSAAAAHAASPPAAPAQASPAQATPGPSPAARRVPSPAEIVSRNPAESITRSRPLRPLRSVTEFLDSVGMSFGQVLEIVEKPEGIEAGLNGATVYRSAEYRVVVGEDDVVLAVYPVNPQNPHEQRSRPSAPERERVEEERTPTPPQTPGNTADLRLPVPDTREELLALLHSHGFELTEEGRHQKIVHPNHPGLVLATPTTPSDRRWVRNQLRDVRKVFGVDLRKPVI